MFWEAKWLRNPCTMETLGWELAPYVSRQWTCTRLGEPTASGTANAIHVTTIGRTAVKPSDASRTLHHQAQGNTALGTFPVGLYVPEDTPIGASRDYELSPFLTSLIPAAIYHLAAVLDHGRKPRCCELRQQTGTHLPG